ncbi:MAG: hypothetical protein QM770_09355 [Tepidisphaeraceae bacterium]
MANRSLLLRFVFSGAATLRQYVVDCLGSQGDLLLMFLSVSICMSLVGNAWFNSEIRMIQQVVYLLVLRVAGCGGRLALNPGVSGHEVLYRLCCRPRATGGLR